MNTKRKIKLILGVMVLTFLSTIPNLRGFTRYEETVFLGLNSSSHWIELSFAEDDIIHYEMETSNSPFNFSCWATGLNDFICANKTYTEGSFTVYKGGVIIFMISNTDTEREGNLHIIIEKRIINSFSLILIIGLATVSIVLIIIKTKRLRLKK